MTHKTKERIFDVFVMIVAVCIGLVLVFPVIYCALGAFKTSAEFMQPKLLPASFSYTQNFKDALARAPLFRYMLNSCIMALIGTAVRLVFSTCAAFVFSHYTFRGKNLVFYLLLGTMMLPGDILLMSNYATVSHLGLLGSVPGLYLGMCITSFVSASQMFMLRQRFLGIPKDLRNAAMIDGCGDIRYILQVLIPICRPIIVTLFVQSFITLWNSYLWPMIITANAPDMRTIMVGITRLNSWEDTNYELVLAGVTLSLIPSMALFVIMRRSMRKGGTEGSLVG